jgi:hypothetical protein
MFKLINFKRKKLSFVKKWESYGFLDGVSRKEVLSEAYEKILNIFSYDDNVKKLRNYNELSTMIFVIMRCFHKNGVTFNCDDELYTLIKKLNNDYDTIKDLHCHMTTLDMEAEFIDTFVFNYRK